MSLNRAPDPFTSAPPLTKGGWLYVYVYSAERSVQNIQYAIKVDKTSYTNWYNSYDKINDPYELKLK